VVIVVIKVNQATGMPEVCACATLEARKTQSRSIWEAGFVPAASFLESVARLIAPVYLSDRLQSRQQT